MSKETYDVFLSYTAADAGSASAVERAMASAGLRVFKAWDISLGTHLEGAVLEALIESKALVALISPLSAKSTNIAFELGMAMSWRKPVYLLLDGAKPEDLFGGARSFHVHPISELATVVDAVKGHLSPLTPEDRRRLIRAYEGARLPTDRLLANPAALEELSIRFQRLGGREVSGERLASELLRLRKGGKLPRIRATRARAQAAKGAA